MAQFTQIITFFNGLFTSIFSSFIFFNLNVWWVIVGFSVLGILLNLAFHNKG